MPKKSIARTFDAGDSDGGDWETPPPGNYQVKLTEAEEGVSSNDNEMWTLHFQGTEGKAKNHKFWYYVPLNLVWKIKQTARAFGQEIPENGPFTVDPTEFIGDECMAEVYHDEWQGKTRAKIRKIEPLGTTGKKSKSVATISAEEVEDMSEEELEDVIEKFELELDLSGYKTPKRKINAVVAALDAAGKLEA